jgi:Uma2 family endonuclease
MALVEKLQHYSADEYLDQEQRADVRHELVGGQMFAMVGASNIHNLIAGSLFSYLRSGVKDRCHVYMSDMKVRIENDFYYPDIVVSCEEAKKISYYLDNPQVIIEVISPSTEMRDKMEKRIAYQRLPTLKEYVLIYQEKISVEVFRRIGEGWEKETYSEGDVIEYASLAFEIKIESIYEDVLKYLSDK